MVSQSRTSPEFSKGEGACACAYDGPQATASSSPSSSSSQQRIGNEDMRSYLPCLPLCIFAVRARPYVAIIVSFVFDFDNDVRVRSEGIWLVDPSVYFLRDPKACCAPVGAWLVKEELVVGLFVTPELWCWPTISRVLYCQLGIHQHTGHRLRFDGTVVNDLRIAQLPWSTVYCSWEFDADSSRSGGHRGM